MKSSFPKCVKRHSRRWACNTNAKFKDCLLVKSFSHMYISVCICVYIYVGLFCKTWSPILALTLIFGLGLNALWKRALHINIYSKTSLTDHLHRSTTPLYQSLYFGPKWSPIQIFVLPKTNTSLNGPPKISLMVGRFREVLL